jgi:RHS repeat-associated protein
MGSTAYYFPERHYESGQGRWLSPDPAGLAAVNASNPQSWNRYAYVSNSPLNAVDPLGLRQDWTSTDPGEQDCSASIDGGGPVPCGLLGSGEANISCPGGDCSPFGKRYTSSKIGGDFSLVASVNGLVWVNDFNGTELNPDAADEAGLFVQSNPSLIPGWDPTVGGWKNGALNLLKNRPCSTFFGGKGANTMKAAQFLPFGGDTHTFAETYPGSKIVWINTTSVVFQSLPWQRFDEPLRPGGLSALDSGIYGLLHELSHQLKSMTGAAYDGGPNRILQNYWNSLRVMNACPQ